MTQKEWSLHYQLIAETERRAFYEGYLYAISNSGRLMQEQKDDIKEVLRVKGDVSQIVGDAYEIVDEPIEEEDHDGQD
ncbi:MAG: hypothetical protein ACOC2N_02900 [Spirochaetota bacterium]